MFLLSFESVRFFMQTTSLLCRSTCKLSHCLTNNLLWCAYRVLRSILDTNLCALISSLPYPCGKPIRTAGEQPQAAYVQDLHEGCESQGQSQVVLLFPRVCSHMTRAAQNCQCRWTCARPLFEYIVSIRSHCIIAHQEGAVHRCALITFCGCWCHADARQASSCGLLLFMAMLLVCLAVQTTVNLANGIHVELVARHSISFTRHSTASQ